MGSNWSLAEIAARFLERDEREAVLGDLAEAGERSSEKLFAVLGLVVRRQVMLWKNWRPWLAGFGVALPSSFALMGVSVSVSWSYQRLLCPELLKAASLTLRFRADQVLLASITADRLVVDGRIRCGLHVASNVVGERRVVLFALFILFIEVSDRIAFAALSAFVFAASDMGSSPRIAHYKDQTGASVDFGSGDNRVDDPCVERGTKLVDRAAHEFELGAKLARVVPRGDGARARCKAHW